MRFSEPLVPATLIRRYKRFLADVALEGGEVVTVHCANPGSMLGCAPEGAPVLLSYHPGTKRKLAYSWELVHVGTSWVGINTGRPNAIVRAAVAAGAVPELAGYAAIEAERPYGERSRIDLLLTAEGRRRCFVEIKSVTIAEGALALFPDSVTARGLKHLRELGAQVRSGDRAVMFFLVQREDCRAFRPAAHIDPAYAAGLAEAAGAGVELLCYDCEVGPDGVALRRRLPVELGG